MPNKPFPKEREPREVSTTYTGDPKKKVAPSAKPPVGNDTAANAAGAAGGTPPAPEHHEGE